MLNCMRSNESGMGCFYRAFVSALMYVIVTAGYIAGRETTYTPILEKARANFKQNSPCVVISSWCIFYSCSIFSRGSVYTEAEVTLPIAISAIQGLTIGIATYLVYLILIEVCSQIHNFAFNVYPRHKPPACQFPKGLCIPKGVRQEIPQSRKA